MDDKNLKWKREFVKTSLENSKIIWPRAFSSTFIPYHSSTMKTNWFSSLVLGLDLSSASSLVPRLVASLDTSLNPILVSSLFQSQVSSLVSKC